MSNVKARVLELVLEGCAKTLPFRPALSKGENVYWGVLKVDPNTGDRFSSKYGVKVKPLGAELPRKITIVDPESGAKVEIPLERNYTDDNRDRVQHKGSKIVLPGVAADLGDGDDGTRRFAASISVTKDKQWQVKISATNISGGNAGPSFDAEDL